MADPRISEEKGTKRAQKEIPEQKFNEEFKKSLAVHFGPSAILEVKEMLTSMKDLAIQPVDSLYSFGQYLSENPIKASIEVGKAMLAVTDIQAAQKSIEKARQTGARKDLNTAADLTCKAFTSFVLTYGTLAVGGAAATNAGKIAKTSKTAKAAKTSSEAIKEMAEKTVGFAKKSNVEEASLKPAILKVPSEPLLKHQMPVASLKPAVLKSPFDEAVKIRKQPELALAAAKKEPRIYGSGSGATALKVAEEVAIYEGPALKEFEKITDSLKLFKSNQVSGQAGREISNKIQGIYHTLESNFEKITITVTKSSEKMKSVKEFRLDREFASKLARQPNPKKAANLLLNEPKISIENVIVNPVGKNAGIANIKIEGTIGNPIFCRARFAEESGKTVYRLYQ